MNDEHRKELKKTVGVGQIYTWLVKQGFPIGYRVLCMNCNFAKRFGNKCPHEVETN